jgi:hypothetical protein
LDRRLGGLQSRYGRRGEEKYSQLTPGIEPQNPEPMQLAGALKLFGFGYLMIRNEFRENVFS